MGTTGSTRSCRSSCGRNGRWILRLIGHGHGDRLGPICRHGEVETAERAFRDALEADQHDVFIGDWVAGDRRWAHVLGGRVVRKTGYPILRLADDSWDELLASQSQRFRKSLRNKRNRLEHQHEVTYRYADSESLDAISTRHSAFIGPVSARIRASSVETTNRSSASSPRSRTSAAGCACCCWSSTASPRASSTASSSRTRTSPIRAVGTLPGPPLRRVPRRDRVHAQVVRGRSRRIPLPRRRGGLQVPLPDRGSAPGDRLRAGKPARAGSSGRARGRFAPPGGRPSSAESAPRV